MPVKDRYRKLHDFRTRYRKGKSKAQVWSAEIHIPKWFRRCISTKGVRNKQVVDPVYERDTVRSRRVQEAFQVFQETLQSEGCIVLFFLE